MSRALQTVVSLDGKMIVDIIIPLTPDHMGLTIGRSTSAADEIAKAVPALKLSRFAVLGSPVSLARRRRPPKARQLRCRRSNAVGVTLHRS